jgi:hypothetical protein
MKGVVEYSATLGTSDLSGSLPVSSKHIIDDPAVDAGDVHYWYLYPLSQYCRWHSALPSI